MECREPFKKAIFFVAERIKMIYGCVDALIVIGADVADVRIFFDIVIKENSRHCGVGKLLHPFVMQGESELKRHRRNRSLTCMYQYFSVS